MKKFFIWYLPQAALFLGTFWFLHVDALGKGERLNVMGAIVVGAMLAAAYTGGANLLMSLTARLRDRLRSHGSDASSDSLRLVGPRRRLGQPAEHGERIRVGK